MNATFANSLPWLRILRTKHQKCDPNAYDAWARANARFMNFSSCSAAPAFMKIGSCSKAQCEENNLPGNMSCHCRVGIFKRFGSTSGAVRKSGNQLCLQLNSQMSDRERCRSHECYASFLRKNYLSMKTQLSLSPAASVETECLVVVVIDQGTKDKPEAVVQTSDGVIRQAAAEVISSGEVTGKSLETSLLHRPANLKAKRLLLIGGGKAKTFDAPELRKLAGTAVRFLKGRGVRSFAFLIPENGIAAAEGVKAVVEGAFVGNFDPDVYKSDRKDQNHRRSHRGGAGRSGRVAEGNGRSANHRRVTKLYSRLGE